MLARRGDFVAGIVGWRPDAATAVDDPFAGINYADSMGPIGGEQVTRFVPETPLRRRIDWGSSWGMLALAVGGAGLAGGLYPLVLALVKLTLDAGLGGSPDGAELAAFVLLGGMVGFCLALIVAINVAIFAALVGWTSGIASKSIWFASLIGGWSGFLATHMTLDVFPTSNMWILVGLATVTGQVGSAWAVWRYRRAHESPTAGAVPDDSRFGLRQMFGATTAVALLFASLRAFGASPDLMATVWLAIGLQAAMIGLGFFLNAWRVVKSAN